MKNGSSASVLAGRARTSPQRRPGHADSGAAARFGYQPSSAAIARIAPRVSLRDAGPAVQRVGDGAFRDARRCAMSAIVTLRAESECASDTAISLLDRRPLLERTISQEARAMPPAASACKGSLT